MAGHQSQRARLRAGAIAAAAALALSACRAWSREFRVAGTITLSAPLQAKARQMNAVLFIIAKNRGGVPVAIRRVVNPEFPVPFTLSEEDLLVPGTRPEDPLTLEAQMNTHGNVGTPARGDLQGTCRDSVRSGERGASIVIDREL